MKTRIHKKEVAALQKEGFQRCFWTQWDYDLLKHVQIRQRQGMSKKTYADAIIMSDTETSKKTLYPLTDEERRNHVCAWSIAIRAYHENVCVLWGIKPSDLAKCLRKIREKLPADEVVIYFHNLAYDWVFIRKFLMKEFGKPKTQLSTKPLYPIQIKFENGITLKDSLILAQRGLEKWGEDMKVEHAKAVGKWKYDEIRNQKDFLPNADELDYMSCDVLCGVECIDATMKNLKKTLGSLPLTATGIVRGEARSEGKENHAHDWAVKLLPETYADLLIQEAVYHGGYTHGNKYAAGVIFPGRWFNMVNPFVYCKDFASSYPFVMLTRKFPAEKFWKPKRKTFTVNYVLDNVDDFAFIFKIKCKGVKLKDPRNPMPVIGASKCIMSINTVNDNGRVRSADYLETYVTEMDFKIIYAQYDFDKLELCEMQCAAKDYLPRWLTDYVYKRFILKTTLKGVDPVLYAIEKAKLNAIYGMTAQKCVKEVLEEIYEDEELDGIEYKSGDYRVKTDYDPEKEYQKHLNNRNTFLPYCIGIWVTAYAQYNLFELGKCVPESEMWLYSDTDSIYATGFDEEKVAAYNEECKRMLTERGYGAVRHKDKDYWLGVAEDDGTYMQFKELHAKCYAKRPLVAIGDNFIMGDSLKITVAGVPKRGAVSLQNNLENFKDGFIFDGITSGKKQHTHFFVDEIYEDENGNETGDSIDLSPCDYLVKELPDLDDLLGEEEEVEIIDYEESAEE